MSAWSTMREAIQSLLRWFAVNGGGEARRLHALLEREYRFARTPTDATHGEQVVALSVIGTVNRLMRTAGRRLRSCQRQLTKAAADAVAGEQSRRQFDSPHRRDERADREREHLERQQDLLKDKLDHDAPTVPRLVLLVVEAIIVLVEAGFWYAFFSRSIDSNASDVTLLRTGAIGLALLLPLVALLSAHFAGATWQRLIKHRTPGRLGQQLAGALTALLIIGVLTGLVYWLVDFRFSFRSPYSIQPATATPPADALALLFASTVVVVAAVRTFMTSEVHEQWLARDRSVKSDRAVSDRLDATVLRANAVWTKAWYEMAAGVDRILVEIEQVVAAGERVILRARSQHTDTAFITPGRSPRPGLPPMEWSEEGVTLPWHTMIELLDTELMPVRRSLQLLKELQPAALTVDDQLAGLESRLALVMPVDSNREVPAPAQADPEVEEQAVDDQAEVTRLPRPIVM